MCDHPFDVSPTKERLPSLESGERATRPTSCRMERYLRAVAADDLAPMQTSETLTGLASAPDMNRSRSMFHAGSAQSREPNTADRRPQASYSCLARASDSAVKFGWHVDGRVARGDRTFMRALAMAFHDPDCSDGCAVMRAVPAGEGWQRLWSRLSDGRSPRYRVPWPRWSRASSEDRRLRSA